MSSKLINFNGNLVDVDFPILNTTNRGFAYGDGLFETLRMSEGLIPFLSSHYERLVKGTIYLGIDLPNLFTQDFLLEEINRVATSNSRIRITITRSQGGKYLPTDNTPTYLIESEPLDSSKFKLNKKGKRVTEYKGEYIACTPLSNLKTCNSLPYILASQYYKTQGFDDSLILNEYGRICEASSSNVFIVKGNTVTTPPLSEGCIEGVTRKQIIELLEKKGIYVAEKQITASQVTQADEIWLTNSIQGIQWVAKLHEHQYSNLLAQKAVDWLNARITAQL